MEMNETSNVPRHQRVGAVPLVVAFGIPLAFVLMCWGFGVKPTLIVTEIVLLILLVGLGLFLLSRAVIAIRGGQIETRLGRLSYIRNPCMFTSFIVIQLLTPWALIIFLMKFTQLAKLLH
jgi:hypothetical protein